MSSAQDVPDGLEGTSQADPEESASGPGVEPSVEEPPLVTLTQLEPFTVTKVWPTEPHHFTPWLLKNSKLLSEVLGIDVELESREYRVGRFSLDIVGRETATRSPVIIENQFGTTDHGHLGQILTYAGGTKPTTIVWVAEQFREEHRAALDWLNAHTDPTIRFFGVKLAAVTLAGAPSGLVAPFLELVVKPNDWEKRANAAATVGASATTPTQELYRKFWSLFEPLAKQREWTSATASPQGWWTMPTGVGGVNWTVSYAQFGCRSELFFGHTDPAVNLARWHILKDKEAELSSTFGPGLIFDELPKAKGCRIETRLNGPKISEQDKWPSVLDWMVDTQQRLRKAVDAVGGVPAAISEPPSEDKTP